MSDKIERVKLKGSRYALRRERDGVGDSGPMLQAIDRSKALTWGDINSGSAVVSNGEIILGFSVVCGSFMARTFGSDWWLTTNVTEIIEVNEDNTKVKFKTGNSVYEVVSW